VGGTVYWFPSGGSGWRRRSPSRPVCWRARCTPADTRRLPTTAPRRPQMSTRVMWLTGLPARRSLPPTTIRRALMFARACPIAAPRLPRRPPIESSRRPAAWFQHATTPRRRMMRDVRPHVGRMPSPLRSDRPECWSA